MYHFIVMEKSTEGDTNVDVVIQRVKEKCLMLFKNFTYAWRRSTVVVYCWKKTVGKFEIKVYHPKENAYGLLRNISLKVYVNPFFRVAKMSYRKRYKHSYTRKFLTSK